jgi:hypothetical protein
MAAINFDQPSAGTVNASSNALSIKNSGTGGGLECIVNSPTSSGIGVRNEQGHGIWTESKGGTGLVAKSATGDAINAATNSTASSAIVAGNGTGHGIWAESRGNGAGVIGNSKSGTGVVAGSDTSHGIWAESRGNAAGIVGKSATGHGIWGESLAGNAGIVGKSATGNGVHAESLGGGVGLNAVSASGVGVRAKGGNLAGYFEGNVQVTGDIGLVNADCAEEFNMKMQVEPGTVMVIDNNGLLEPSSIPYDKRAAGIVSGAGSFKPAILLDKQERKHGENDESNACRMAIALMGKVYCKVDATLSSIDIGDLLTTSPTIGHAMKASDPFKAFGAVIGKALQPLKDGKGIIPVLVALQ